MRKKVFPPKGEMGKVIKLGKRRRKMAQKLGGPRELAKTGASELIRHFLSNRAPTTLKAYRADLDAFGGFLEAGSTEEAIARLVGYGASNANLLAYEWLGAMREAKLSGSTRARRISSIRSLISLGRALGLVDWDLDIRPPRFESAARTVPEVANLKILLNACGDGLLGTRDRALLLLAITMGLRRSELAWLTLGDYQRSRRRILVHGKGGRATWMVVPPKTARALDEWLCLSLDTFCASSEQSSDLPADTPIFVRLDRSLSERHRAMTPDGIYVVVRRIGKRAGFRVCPHDLRNASIAAALSGTNGDIRSVQRFGRFSDPSSVLSHEDRRQDIPGDISETIAALSEGKRR